MSRMRKLITLNVIIIISLVLVSACSGISQKPQTTTLRISWTLWQGDYTMLVAERMGYFAANGVQVKPVFYAGESESIPDLAGNQLDGGIYTISDTLLASRLVDLKVVMISDQGSQYSIIASPDIKTVNDLRGKRIGLNIHTSSEIFVNDMLKSKRMTSHDVTLVEVSPDEVAKRIPNDIDAGVVWEPYTTEAVKQGKSIVFQDEEESLLIPRVIVFRQSVAEKYPNEVKAFLQAWNSAVLYRTEHPEEALALIQKATNFTVDQLKINGNIKLYTIEDSKKSLAITAGSDYRSIFYMAGFAQDFLLSEGYLSDFPRFNVLLDPTFLQ